MMGKKSGVAARLRNRIGAHHVTTHYVAHNLELSVTDTIKEVPYYTPSLKTWYNVFSSSTFIHCRSIKLYCLPPWKYQKISSTGEDGAKGKGYLKELKTEMLVTLYDWHHCNLGQLCKQFQNEDLFTTKVVSKVTKAKLQVESLKDGGECYKSFCSKYDTQS